MAIDGRLTEGDHDVHLSAMAAHRNTMKLRLMALAAADAERKEKAREAAGRGELAGGTLDHGTGP